MSQFNLTVSNQKMGNSFLVFVVRYLSVISVSLIIGLFNADIVGLSYLTVILFWFLKSNNSSGKVNSLILAVTWFFIYGFFIGQQSFSISIVEKILVKPGFIFSLLLIIDILSKYPYYKLDKIIRIHLILILIIVLGLIISPNSFSVLLTRHSYFFLYWIMINVRIQRSEPTIFKKGVSAMIALGIVQVVVSYLQIYGFIPAPSIQLYLGDGKIMDWTAGLDDVASGTFGPMQSPDTSWFQTLIFGMCLTISLMKKNLLYLAIGFFILLQYTFVDSKTMLGVTLIFILIFLSLIIKSRVIRRQRLRYLTTTFILITLFGYFFYQLWRSYYDYYDQNVKWNAGFERVQDYSTNSFISVLENIDDWGKIKGFKNVLIVQSDESWLKTLVGFGPGNYLYETKISKVFELDTPIMQMNNFTRSTSGLLIMFAESGIIGFLLILWLYYTLYHQIYKSTRLFKNLNIRVAGIFLISFILGSLISAFLYGTVKTYSKSIFGFWFLTILFLRLINYYRISPLNEKNTVDYI